jgi:hypothetical protein
MFRDDDAVYCKVFGYYTAFAEGPVRELKAGYLGSSTLLHDAELLMRKTDYPYEFYVIEYPDRGGLLSRYYDEHKQCKFMTHRSVPQLVG